MNKGKVFVGLSGGVDSAVSAALLKQEGYDVTGVFIKVWHPDFLPCNWREERRDAMRVAVKLDIPFLFFDFEKEYKEGVVDNMINEYKAGRTPNPDVLCNRVIKFGSFWKMAKEKGADFIATGHYAQITRENEIFLLKEGKDKNKDQSYFLWTLTREDLSHTLFPVGSILKEDVRKIAKSLDLPISDKKDSQGICFMGDVDLIDFLKEFIEVEPGNVLNINGNIIGKHKGAIFYTIGERHGFEVTEKTPASGAFYVLRKDLEKNTITVTDNKFILEKESPKNILVEELNWINQKEKEELSARIRYRQTKSPIEITEVLNNEAKVHFINHQEGVADGQSIVFYKNDICVGGGIMKNKIS
jgi:tRNA-specific 2-thiouridylase